VLRLRGRSSLGATFVSVIDEYADRLHRANQINGTSHVRGG
jgi:hypothetical protein